MECNCEKIGATPLKSPSYPNTKRGKALKPVFEVAEPYQKQKNDICQRESIFTNI